LDRLISIGFTVSDPEAHIDDGRIVKTRAALKAAGLAAEEVNYGLSAAAAG
jgi:hypothetical protein